MTALGQISIAHAPAETRRRSAFWPLVGLVALVGFGKAIQADTMDPDAFWHLRVADQLLADGIGPLVDRISFASMKTPWAPYSWLAELFMHGLWNAGGFRLAQLVTAVCSAGILLLMAAIGRERSERKNDLAVVLLTAVAALFTLPFISFRPVTFGLLLMAGVVLLLVRDRQKPSPAVWAVVPMTLLLTNLHLYAVLVVGIVWATAIGGWLDDRRHFKRNALLAIATTLAACATPMLPGAIATALSYQSADPMVASPFITEMRPFYWGTGGKVGLGLFLAGVGLCVWKRKSLNATDWLWLTIGTVLLWRLGRFSPVFAMLAMPAVARAFPTMTATALGKPLVRYAVLGVLALGLLNVLPALAENDFGKWLNRNNAAYPVAAADFVEKNVPNRTHRLVNEFNWGGYLAWRFGDTHQVLMDGRTQLYSPEFWRSTHLGDFAKRRALMQTVTADAAILPAKDSALSPALLDLGWREAYRDDLAVVLVP
ncbi:MAG: hypothetical protein QM754_00450 [Tepidisphaeraceae bacterium]